MPLPFLIMECVATMDLLIFAAGVFLFTRKHWFLGSILILFGALYMILGALHAYLRYWS